MSVKPSLFKYSETDWAKVESFATPDTTLAARRALESAGSRYLMSTLHPDRTQDEALIWKYEKRRKIAKLARNFLAEIEHVGRRSPLIGPSQPQIRAKDIGLGRHAGDFDLDFTELLELRGKLNIIAAWIEADKLDFFPRESSAHKPAKNYLVGRVLTVWETTLGKRIPAGGGNVGGPAALYLQASCNPILARGADGVISTGDQARKLIKAYLEKRPW